MGIRFFCPNGHKLNVKAFLAGKRGVCPECGAKLVIPSHSTGPSHKSPTSNPPAEVPVQSAVSTEGAPLQPLWPESELTPRDGVEQSKTLPPISPAQFGPLIFEELDFNALEARAAPISRAHSRQASGPSRGTAEVAWYVQLPSGGQFGPATSDVIHSWIEEGRVPPDSLVWREGWRDWRVVSKAFPQLAAQQEQDQLRSIDPRRPLRPVPVAMAQGNRPRFRSSRAALLTLMLAVTALMVLLGALIWARFAP